MMTMDGMYPSVATPLQIAGRSMRHAAAEGMLCVFCDLRHQWNP
jgi:hypothetical protein